MKYINNIENFTRGIYEGENLYDVADEDPGYIRNLIENNSLEFEERLLLAKSIGETLNEDN